MYREPAPQQESQLELLAQLLKHREPSHTEAVVVLASLAGSLAAAWLLCSHLAARASLSVAGVGSALAWAARRRRRHRDKEQALLRRLAAGTFDLDSPASLRASWEREQQERQR